MRPLMNTAVAVFVPVTRKLETLLNRHAPLFPSAEAHVKHTKPPREGAGGQG